MKRRFSDEQIIGMIKKYEAGVKTRWVNRIASVFKEVVDATGGFIMGP